MHVRIWSWRQLRHVCRWCGQRWPKTRQRCLDEPRTTRFIGMAAPVALAPMAPDRGEVFNAGLIRPYVSGKANGGRFDD
jgi:hypothetical protein